MSKVYFAQDGTIQVHQSRVALCPPAFPAGYYWYGTKRHSPGRPPKWTRTLLEKGPNITAENDTSDEDPEIEDPPGEENDESVSDHGDQAPEPEPPEELELSDESDDEVRHGPRNGSSRYPLRRNTQPPNYWRC